MKRILGICLFLISIAVKFIKGSLVRFTVLVILLSAAAVVYLTSSAVMISVQRVVSEYNQYYYSDFAWIPDEEAAAVQKEYGLTYGIKEIQTAENYRRTGKSMAVISAFIYGALIIYSSVNVVNANKENTVILYALGFGRISLFKIIFMQITALLLSTMIIAFLVSIPVSVHFLSYAHILLSASAVMESAVRLMIICVISTIIPICRLSGMISRMR